MVSERSYIAVLVIQASCYWVLALYGAITSAPWWLIVLCGAMAVGILLAASDLARRKP